MNTIIVKIHCPICGGFELEHEIDVNEHGYFVLPDSAYCPKCLALLVWVIDKKEN